MKVMLSKAVCDSNENVVYLSAVFGTLCTLKRNKNITCVHAYNLLQHRTEDETRSSPFG